MPSEPKPGRIQTLTGEQEIVLKQVWAYLLKFWGYDLDISDSDIAFKRSFVASSTTSKNELKKSLSGQNINYTSTNNSITTRDTSLLFLRKKRNFFGWRKKSCGQLQNSERLKHLQTLSSSERYVPIKKPSERYHYIYSHYYKQGYKYSDGYESIESSEEEEETEAKDTNSVNSSETFTTASPSYSNEDNNVSRKEDLVLCRKKVPKRGSYKLRDGSINKQVKPKKSILPLKSDFKANTTHNAFFASNNVNLVDNFLLNHVRIRGYDTERSLQLFFKNMEWRSKDFPTADWLLEGDAPSYLHDTDSEFIRNFTVSKSYLRGTDYDGNRIFVFRTRRHYTSDSLPDTKRYIVLTIEWCRLFFRQATDFVDSAVILFDLTGFSLKNADYAAIKFIAEIFEAQYPDSLGLVLLHNAPWIFSIVWDIIKNWIDPVIASRIHFTRTVEELEKYIPLCHIPDFIGGNDSYADEYPIPGNRHGGPPLQKDAKFRKLRKERDKLYATFLETTKQWIESTNPDVSSKYLQDKIDISIKLSENYIQLDPYIRNPGIYDRNGSLKLSI
ncbi:uncharacterized protein PRCAT00003383001 [Priceomyces carsonii]|uniref:uncharacterized protein n=1 Tax=Priceomyces carsonii TaxID=28549 RepID=UPI002ED9976C|nr:unnamed protein product [Priceomyces carsonii]